VDRLLATKSEGAGLIVCAISFQDFQPMWSQITNVTDRRTDRQTDGRHAIPGPRKCTKVHCAVKTAGPICMKFSGKVWTVEWPRDYLIKFRVNSGKWVGGPKVNLLSPDIAIWFDCCILAVLCCYLASENVMKLLFLCLVFGNIPTRGGVCCASHQFLFFAINRTPVTRVSSWEFLSESAILK